MRLATRHSALPKRVTLIAPAWTSPSETTRTSTYIREVRFARRVSVSGNAGGLNGSTQHLLEAYAQGFQQLRIVRER